MSLNIKIKYKKFCVLPTCHSTKHINPKEAHSAVFVKHEMTYYDLGLIKRPCLLYIS